MGCCYYPRPRYQRKTPLGGSCRWCNVEEPLLFGFGVPLAYEVVFPDLSVPWADHVPPPGGYPNPIFDPRFWISVTPSHGNANYCIKIAGSHRLVLDDQSECRYVSETAYFDGTTQDRFGTVLPDYVWVRMEINLTRLGTPETPNGGGPELSVKVGLGDDAENGPEFTRPYQTVARYFVNPDPFFDHCFSLTLNRWDFVGSNRITGPGFSSCQVFPETVTIEETL